MNIILLSGGSGKRLWPLSNDVRSKQFIEVFKKPDGSFESMVQRMYRMIQEIDPDTSVTIATSESQVESIKNQLGDSVGISVEPCRRDTFPAIALAVSYLRDVRGLSESDSVVVCPVDPFVEKEYFKTVQNLQLLADNGKANLSLMGIEPTEPSEKYGYIIPKTKDNVSVVESFKEKPDRRTAEQYISQGALWNAGVFSFKIKYVLEIAEKEFGTSSYCELKRNYSNLKKISFDYAVVEKEPRIQVIRYSGQWKDLGTWDSLTEALDYATEGNVICNDCDNTHVINELGTPLLALGLKNTVVVATPDGILVSDKSHCDKLKSIVPDSTPMFEQKAWGCYSVIETSSDKCEKGYVVRHIIIKSGKKIINQFSGKCDVVWTVVSGTGELYLEGSQIQIKRGSSIMIHKDNHYSVNATSELNIIETTIND